MEPNCFGVTRGEQPLVRASRASKVAGAFLVLFWHAKENVPGGNAFCKRHETLNTRLRSAREFSVPHGTILPFGGGGWDAHRIFDIPVLLLPVGSGGHTIIGHQTDGMVDGVHKNTHILDH